MRVMAWPAFRNRTENPYNAMLYDALTERGVGVLEFSPIQAMRFQYDLLHIHWPDALFKGVGPLLRGVRFAGLCLVLSYVRYVKRCPIVWTVHNLQPHGGGGVIGQHLLPWVLNRVLSGRIYMSNFSKSAHRDYTGPSAVIRHGRYENQYVPTRKRNEVRASLEMSAEEILLAHVGNLNAYKGTLELVQAFRELDVDGVRLLIAGATNDEHFRESIEFAAGGDPRIILQWGWLQNHDLANLILASDFVVLPYSDILNSGSVFLGLELDTPVIAPAKGSLREVSSDVGEEWLRLYQGEFTSRTLKQLLEPYPQSQPDLGLFQWNTIAGQTLSFFNSVISSSKRRSIS